MMEEFGLGNMEIIKALSPFPGFGGTGWMCGGVTGALIAFGLYFGSDDRAGLRGRWTDDMARPGSLWPCFEGEVGAVYAPDIMKTCDLGRNWTPRPARENMEAFARRKGF